MLSASSLVATKHVSLPVRASIKTAATGRAQARSIAYSRQIRTQGRRPAHAFFDIRASGGRITAPGTHDQVTVIMGMSRPGGPMHMYKGRSSAVVIVNEDVMLWATFCFDLAESEPASCSDGRCGRSRNSHRRNTT